MNHSNKMPEDSTLRRHYETHLRMTGKRTTGQAPTGHAPTGHAPDAHTPSSSAPAGPHRSGGLGGWLKRLFGG